MNDLARLDMTEAEARECVSAIKGDVETAVKAASSARRRVMELHDRNGWKSLGYRTWDECIGAEFGQSRRTVYRQLQAGKVELELCQFGTSGEIPESHLRALARLPEGQRSAAWSEVIRLANGRKPTAEMVEHVVRKVIDAEFLAEFPIRAGLDDQARRIFDGDALLWRDTRGACEAYEAAMRPRLAELEAWRMAEGISGPLQYEKKVRSHLAAARRHPRDWALCPDCDGSGQIQLIGECPACYGCGYTLWPKKKGGVQA